MNEECTDSCIGVLCKHWPFSVEREIAYYDNLIAATKALLEQHQGDPYYRQKLWNYEVKRANLQEKIDRVEQARTREIR